MSNRTNRTPDMSVLNDVHLLWRAHRKWIHRKRTQQAISPPEEWSILGITDLKISPGQESVTETAHFTIWWWIHQQLFR